MLVALYIARPDGTTVHDTIRLLPDTIRMVRGLATDRAIPLRTRIPVLFLVVYLASPIDLVPDFIPVVGYADDAIITSLVLRRLIRSAGTERIRAHWPGTADGFDRLCRLLRIPSTT